MPRGSARGRAARGRGYARCPVMDNGEGEDAPGHSSLRVQGRIATSSRACWESWRAALLPGRPPCLGRPLWDWPASGCPGRVAARTAAAPGRSCGGAALPPRRGGRRSRRSGRQVRAMVGMLARIPSAPRGKTATWQSCEMPQPLGWGAAPAAAPSQRVALPGDGGGGGSAFGPLAGRAPLAAVLPAAPRLRGGRLLPPMAAIRTAAFRPRPAP